MAHLANCPQCDHELLVPDGVATGSWVRCPGCQAFFQLKEAQARELPTVEVITTATDPNTESEIDHSRPTLADFSSSATLADHTQDSAEFDNASGEREALKFDERSPARPQSYDDLGFRELGALFDSNEVAEENQPHSQAGEAIDVDDERDSEVAQLHVADVEDSDALDVDEEATADNASDEATPTAETPEEAAERIDAWFRSAKTLADIPPVQNPDVDYRADHESLFGPSPPAGNNATIEIGSVGIEATNDDFELDAPEESPTDVATWDDTQHMERLLAQIDEQPQDEYEPAADAADSAAVHEWAADAAIPHAPQKERRGKKRSLARTMVAAVIGGFMAVPLAAYSLMWIGGPEGDFLGAAKYLPQVMLPASFKTKPQQATAAPLPVGNTTDDATTDTSTGTATASTPATEGAANAIDSTEGTAKVTEPPAEKLATFNEPLDTKKPAEPAPFNAPPAAPPLKDSADIGEPIQIAGLPSFKVADLSAALEAGKKAEPGLVTGSFGDSDAINRTKGLSYLILADLAQKATFVDDATSGETKAFQQESEDIFRRILSDIHTRNEVGQIVLKWISSPNRKQGGVFFAGSVLGCEARGSVSECSVMLPGGQTLPVLIPASAAEQAKASRTPVAVVGWIVNDPVRNVTGYTGSASQAIFAPRLISLE